MDIVYAWDTYRFSLNLTESPQKIVEILKEYSSGNVKIEVRKHCLFNTKPQWY